MNNRGESDIICAIATAPGMGGIAVIRISGKGCIHAVDKIFKACDGKKLAELPPNYLKYGFIYEDNVPIDEVMTAVFHAPHSFTGEETVEIQCHGSVYIQQCILQLLLKLPIRLAGPGEFTQRAFFNGRIDLAQAEAVADLIASSSATAHKIAFNQLKGGISKELLALREQLLQLSSLLELELDFAEEDVEFADRKALKDLASRIIDKLGRLCDSFATGNAVKNGIPVVLAGATNVGKSTLLNGLLKEERAIVSEIAGTTRDTVEETLVLKGIRFRLIDTAGIRATKDDIEKQGIARTFSKITMADIVLLLADINGEPEDIRDEYTRIKNHLSPSARLSIILNKSDKTGNIPAAVEKYRRAFPGEDLIPISAKKDINTDALIERLTGLIDTDSLDANTPVVSNVRHYEALSKARNAMLSLLSSMESGISSEFLAQDIRECNAYLGEVTGQITSDQILSNIFRNFCIGK